jgi:NAD(P)-dependent dehydrogenase (short-subunit alcohol dehydrogenase family)
MMTSRSETVAVIGGAAGIGAATGRRLTSDGHRVITVDGRDADVVCDLGMETGRWNAVARVSRVARGVLDGLVVAPRMCGYEAGSVVMSTNYFGSVVVLEGLRPVLARSGHAAVVVGTTWSSVPPPWPVELEWLCLHGDEARARRLADTVGTVSALAASTAALARYVRRHALTPAWMGAAIRLNTVTAGNIDELRVSADLNDDESIQDLERFRVAAEAVAGRIVFALGPEARAFWRVACEAGTGTSSSGPFVDLRQAHSTIRAG